jgi:hypothetical protein
MDERWSREQGIDRLVSAGRQLVDGVSGARPGSRKASRGAGMRPRLGDLGRWVEDKLEWILEDEDDWREPWQEPRPTERPPGRRLPAQSVQPGERRPDDSARGSTRRRPLEAVSRRGAAVRPDLAPPAAEQDWPDDDSFSRPRWQRSGVSPAQPSMPPQPSMPAGARPLPRSSRRRQPD